MTSRCPDRQSLQYAACSVSGAGAGAGEGGLGAGRGAGLEGGEGGQGPGGGGAAPRAGCLPQGGHSVLRLMRGGRGQWDE